MRKRSEYDGLYIPKGLAAADKVMYAVCMAVVFSTFVISLAVFLHRLFKDIAACG
jgi:hypothetical protein